MKLLVTLLAFGLPAIAGAELPAALAGCWQDPAGEPGSGEVWMAPAGGSMLGMARTLKGGRQVQFEFQQLRLEADGGLVFIAQPNGRPPTRFLASRSGPEEWVFDNPDHDFPQRVAYRIEAADRVAARIEGPGRDGRWRVVAFPLRRVACPA